jgi:hypothetical protein
VKVVKTRHACVLPGGLDKKYDDVLFHNPCYNATVKCRHRAMKAKASSEEAGETPVQDDKTMMRTKAQNWQTMVKPFLPTSSSDERMGAMKQIEG